MFQMLKHKVVGKGIPQVGGSQKIGRAQMLVLILLACTFKVQHKWRSCGYLNCVVLLR